MDNRKPAPPAASNPSKKKQAPVSASSLHDEKVAIMNRVNTQTGFREEKKALMGAAIGTSASVASVGNVWYPPQESKPHHSNPFAPRRYRDRPFELEPGVNDDEEPPMALVNFDEEDRFREEQESRQRRSNEAENGNRFYIVALVVVVVIAAGLGSAVYVLTGGTNSISPASENSDSSTSSKNDGCTLDKPTLYKCDLYGLQIPACAKETFQELRHLYIPDDTLTHPDLLDECNAGHKALVALAVASVVQAEKNSELSTSEAASFFALAALHFTSKGENWHFNEGWLEGSTSICDWFGVSCFSDDGSMLMELDLSRNNLKGTLPTEIGLLSNNLIALNVARNQIEGTVPREIGHLTNLEKLYLHDSNLDGQLPSEIGNCTRLLRLHMEDASFTGSLPTDIGNLKRLANFTMTGHFMTGKLPTELGNLVRLELLDMQYLGQLTGKLPTEVWQLTKLTLLHIEAGVLSPSPFPTELMLAGMTDLQLLRLGSADLTGSIPSSIGLLTKLIRLQVEFNVVTGALPTELGLLTDLEEVILTHEEFTGTIPTEFGLLTKLTQLTFFHNHLTGTLPSEMGALTVLSDLRLNLNKLSGSIPQEVCALATSTSQNGNNEVSMTRFDYDSCSEQAIDCLLDCSNT